MKRISLLIACAAFIAGCASSSGDKIEDKAVRLVKANYPDCEKIIFVDVDTITLGKNLDYRIEQFQSHVDYYKDEVRRYEREIQHCKRNGLKTSAEMWKAYLSHSDSMLTKNKLALASLDSLKAATIDIADKPAAYQICVAYNYPSNLVWVQLDADGAFLKMSKNMNDLLFNPGADMPGYLDILMKYLE